MKKTERSKKKKRQERQKERKQTDINTYRQDGRTEREMENKNTDRAQKERWRTKIQTENRPTQKQ